MSESDTHRTAAVDMYPPEPIGVLCVAEDRNTLDRCRETIDDGERYVVRTARCATEALAEVPDADCVVATDGLSNRSGIELIREIRERGHDVPCILFPSTGDSDTAAALLQLRDVDYVERTGSPSGFRLLIHRIDQLVGHHYLQSLCRSFLTAIRSVRDGVCILGPDRRFRYVNRVYARRFGYEPNELYGRHWRDVYEATEVDRLESEVLPTVEDAWCWSGTCTGTHRDGETISVSTTLLGLDDGGLVAILPPRTE